MSVRSFVAFFEQFKQAPAAAEDKTSCGKRAREAEAITSPGKVKETKEKLLSPAVQDKEKPATAGLHTVTISPGKVRQSIESIAGIARWPNIMLDACYWPACSSFSFAKSPARS